MDDNQFDKLMRGLPWSFNVPVDPPLEEMWTVIEDAHFNAATSMNSGNPSRPRAQSRALLTPWLAAAAALVIGIGIGRFVPRAATNRIPRPAQASVGVAKSNGDPTEPSAVPDAYRDQTSRYLGQTAALLISLPAKDATGKSDAAFAAKAADLLVTTRLLIDSPAAQDPKMRSLLEDLELVLVQVARLRVERSTGDLDLIHQAVEQGDVLSRLSSAVVTNQSSE
jgi:uncharacterized membrane-anchored protein YhcB (DUF1043 family)